MYHFSSRIWYFCVRFALSVSTTRAQRENVNVSSTPSLQRQPRFNSAFSHVRQMYTVTRTLPNLRAALPIFYATAASGGSRLLDQSTCPILPNSRRPRIGSFQMSRVPFATASCAFAENSILKTRDMCTTVCHPIVQCAP
jgi:hypothetical protein